MEKCEYQNDELIFRPESFDKVANQRKIMDFYLKQERFKGRKYPKSEPLSFQAIQGLLNVLNFNTQKLHFVSEQNLFLQASILIQSASIHILSEYQIATSMQNHKMVLFSGKFSRIRSAESAKANDQFFSFLIQPSENGRKGKQRRKSRSSFRNLDSSQNYSSIFQSSNKSNKENFGFDDSKRSPFKKYRKNDTLQSECQCSTLEVSENECPMVIDKLDGIFDKQYKFQVQSQELVLFYFPKSCIEKFQQFLDEQSKENISKFIGKCFDIDSIRLINKLLGKIQKIFCPNKYKVTLSNKKILLIYKGTLLLDKQYKIELSKYCILWPEGDQKYTLNVTEENTICFILQSYYLHQYFHEDYPEIINRIKEKVNNAVKSRQDYLYFAKRATPTSMTEYSRTQKIFYGKKNGKLNIQDNQTKINQLKSRPCTSQTKILRDKQKIEEIKQNKDLRLCPSKVGGFDLSVSTFGHDYTERKNNILCKPKLKSNKVSNHKQETQERFRVFKMSEHECNNFVDKMYLEAQNKPFMSLYPYFKILESEEKVEEKKKYFGNRKQYTANKQNISVKYKKHFKENELRERKRQFYNEKVKNLKIRNIASREIPNGHKKNFNAQKAQSQIAQNSLIKHVIEYPMEGFNEQPKSTKQEETNSILRKINKNSHKKIAIDESIQVSISKKVEGRHTHGSNMKRTTADKTENSFSYYQGEWGRNGVQKKDKKIQERPKTGKMNKLYKQVTNKKLSSFELKYERINTET